MSRTRRHIPFHYRSLSRFDKTCIGLHEDWYERYCQDHFDSVKKGYDNHRGQSYIAPGPVKTTHWVEKNTYRPKAKRFFKRMNSKYNRRRKIEMR